eukprot:23092-Pelagococcus_subviridis.AAC.8
MSSGALEAKTKGDFYWSKDDRADGVVVARPSLASIPRGRVSFRSLSRSERRHYYSSRRLIVERRRRERSNPRLTSALDPPRALAAGAAREAPSRDPREVPADQGPVRRRHVVVPSDRGGGLYAARGGVLPREQRADARARVGGVQPRRFRHRELVPREPRAVAQLGVREHDREPRARVVREPPGGDPVLRGV